MLVFVNGYLGFGSPEGGAKFWGGESSNFVRQMQNHFFTEQMLFTDQQFPFFSSVDVRSAIGKIWFEKYEKQFKEPIQLITFSMGTAMGMGILEAATRMEIPVNAIIAINSFQARKIILPNSLSPNFWSLDFQNPDDLIINNPLHGKPGKIPNATHHIFQPSMEKDLRYRHKSPLKLNWTELLARKN